VIVGACRLVSRSRRASIPNVRPKDAGPDTPDVMRPHLCSEGVPGVDLAVAIRTAVRPQVFPRGPGPHGTHTTGEREVFLNHIVWTALLLIYGVLCGCTGAAVVAARTRRPPDAGLLDPVDLIAMNALRANHRDEFLRLRNVETAQMMGRRPAPEHPGQDGDDHA
jgi:hypothetical protein